MRLVAEQTDNLVKEGSLVYISVPTLLHQVFKLHVDSLFSLELWSLILVRYQTNNLSVFHTLPWYLAGHHLPHLSVKKGSEVKGEERNLVSMQVMYVLSWVATWLLVLP